MLSRNRGVDKFVLTTIFLFAFVGSFWVYSVAQDSAVIVEKKYPVETQEVNSDPFGEYYEEAYVEDDRRAHPGHKQRSFNNATVLGDSYFNPGQEATFAKLILNVSMIILFLLGVLVMAKIFLRKDSMSSSGGIMSGLTQKVKSGFFSAESKSKIAVQESYVLAPGQMLYVVNINGKKLLLGATHQGGIHFLTDLSAKAADELDFRQIEMLQQQGQGNGDDFSAFFESTKPVKSMNHAILHRDPIANNMEDINPQDIFKATTEEQATDKPRKVVASNSSKSTQSFRQRRAKFRQTLLNSTAARR